MFIFLKHSAPVASRSKKQPPKRKDDSHCYISGAVDERWLFSVLPHGERELVSAPLDLPADATAARIHASGSPINGWIFYFDRERPVSSSLFGSAALVQTVAGDKILGIVMKGHKTGHYSVLTPGYSDHAYENLSAVAAARVLWIQPI